MPYPIKSNGLPNDPSGDQGELAGIVGDDAVASGALADVEGDGMVEGDVVVVEGVVGSPAGSAFLQPPSTEALIKQSARTEVDRMVNSWRCVRRTQAQHGAGLKTQA